MRELNIKSKSSIIILLVSCMTLYVPFAEAGYYEATFLLENSQNTMFQALERINILEKTGQDVTIFISSLNIAAEKIDQSQIAFDSQKYDLSEQLSRESNDIALNVLAEVTELSSGLYSPTEALNRSLFFATIELVAIGVGLFYIYTRIEKVYIKRIYDSYIVVNESES